MVEMQEDVPYDDSNVSSIEEYAKRIVNKTLREALDLPPDARPKGSGGKGAMGETVEEYYFRIRNNNVQGPDFPKVGVELKTTGLRYDAHHKPCAKERLAITNINWMTILNEDFKKSHLMDKMSKILLLAYDYDPGSDSVLDMRFRLATMWGVPERDKPQMLADWNTVLAKVRNGDADKVSSRDTVYLEAATTGSGHGKKYPQPKSDRCAKPRRWALKSSYMTTVINQLFQKEKYASIKREKDEVNLTLHQLVKARFRPYMGKTKKELKSVLQISASEHAKNYYAIITKKILGIGTDKSIEEFDKAGIMVRTIRRSRTGRVKESLSFPAMDYKEVACTDWEDSKLYGYMTTPYLFVVFSQREEHGPLFLSQLVWWTPTDEDLAEACRVYKITRQHILANDYDHFPGIRGLEGNGSHIHVRPHATKGETCLTPQGTRETKKSFWITNKYVQQIIDQASDDRQ